MIFLFLNQLLLTNIRIFVKFTAEKRCSRIYPLSFFQDTIQILHLFKMFAVQINVIGWIYQQIVIT